MTSRLKRKLNDLGVDPAGAKANESFCLVCHLFMIASFNSIKGEYTRH